MNHTIRKVGAFLLSLTMLLPTLAGCTFEGVGSTNSTSAQSTVIPNQTILKGDPAELIISEAMPSNSSTVADSFGEYSDWIELYNPTEYTIYLDGCFLSDSPDKPYKYEFPDIAIGAGQYLLLFASDRNTKTKEGELHTNFKLTAGETLTISSKSAVLSTLALPMDLPDDISYGKMAESSEDYTNVYFATPTPGATNGGIYAEAFGELSVSEIGLRINEFMMKNEGMLYDEDGDCPDWVEIRNTSDKAVSLKGFGLSDSFDEPLKWTFPDITLQPDEYLVVLLSGKTKEYTADSLYLHADFKFSDTDDGLLLSDSKGVLIDRIGVVALPQSASYGRDPQEIGSWKFFTKPTPGKANSQNGFTDLQVFQKALTEKVYINEVCAVSSSKVSSLPNEDWIELYNNTDQAVNLSGWALSKSVADLKRYVLPNITIPAHGYVVITAGGDLSYDTKNPSTGFKVSHTGTTLYLTDGEGYLIDSFETGLQRSGVTSGRVIENDTLTRKFFATPTKGKANNTTAASTYAQPAEMSSTAGVLVADSHTITITTKEKNGVIYYTLDGTVPNENAILYTGPFTLEKSASIRAVVYAEGKLPSQIATQSFLIEEGHSLNVVCLTANPDDLFSYSTGIWANGPGWTETFPHQGANFWKDWEREVYFEYYEKDGSLGIGFSAGIKNHGQYSRAEPQKSVSINLKEAYGSGTSYYPFFGEDEITVFDNLLLRTGGQDSNYTNLIDAYCARVIGGQMDLDYMRDIPVALYVNGEYWGMYYVREKINESYIYYHSGIEADNLDLIKGTKKADCGTFDAHNTLLTYIRNHNLSNQEYFDYVATQIDIEEWTNYWIVESFFANTDTGNIRFYCSKDGTGKWRWILFDMDWALYPSTYKWNMIEEFIDPRGHGSGNMFSTTIAVGLFQNEAYKKYFIETYAQYMKTIFDPDRMIAILDEMVDEIDEEMVRHCARWGAISYSGWQKNITRLHTIIRERWDYSKGDLQETFGLSNAYMKELFPEEDAV